LFVAKQKIRNILLENVMKQSFELTKINQKNVLFYCADDWLLRVCSAKIGREEDERERLLEEAAEREAARRRKLKKAKLGL